MVNTIVATIAICLSVFNLLCHLDIVRIKPVKDKYADYRDPVTGRLTAKKKGEL